MIKFMFFALAIAMLGPAISLAQEAQTLAAPASGLRNSARTQKLRTIAGMVGADGKTFLDSKQVQWIVANSSVLGGFENQRVKVKYLLASGQNRMQILSVKLMAPAVPNSAFRADSAFRR